MRTLPPFLLAMVLAPAAALAGPVTIEGTVIDTHSRWTSDGSRIVTEATVRTADGTDVVVSQLGGTVDGLTMRTFPGPEVLEPGMRVSALATERMDLSQRMHVALDSVRVLAAPPEFVRTGPTKAGNYLFWENSCVYVTPSAEGTREIAGDQELGAISESIAEWNNGTSACSYMNIIEDAPQDREVGRDNVNLIKFRDTSWCRPATGDDPPRCHADSAAGLTTVVFVDDPKSSRDGAIVDADVELNGVNFKIGLNGQSLGMAACLADLKNTLTHELGHLLGLEHPCRTSADPPRTDSKGAPVPTCTAAMTNPSITDATMYNFQDCGETKKASLSQDDIDAICTIYPIAQDPGVCERVGETGGCCSAAPGSGLPLGTLLGAAGIGALVLRRRRRVDR